MAPVALGGDKLALDLLVRREGVYIAGVVRHKVLIALSTPHINPNDALWPRNSIAKLALAN